MTQTRDIAAEPGVAALIQQALTEDIGSGDVTTNPLVAADHAVRATILAREDLVVAGTTIAAAAFHGVDSDLRCDIRIPDGERAAPDQSILEVQGAARAILTAERTALNFMQRLCGIATLTARFVAEAGPHGVDILDTRKTTPCLRRLEKYAVRCGGGRNHRSGLYDMALLKDNHRRLWGRSLADAVARIREQHPGIEVEVEVESAAELRDVLAANPDWVLLDNMSPRDMRACVELADGRCRLEASGGITLNDIADVARTGVNAISLGCLTHSAPSADLSLEIAES